MRAVAPKRPAEPRSAACGGIVAESARVGTDPGFLQRAGSTAASPSHAARSSSSACTAFAIVRLSFTSSWIAFTRSTDAFRSAVASTFPTSRSPWRIGKRVVAPPALGGGLVHLEGVLEVEQLEGSDAVVDEPVERRQQRRPALEVAAEQRRVDAPLSLHALDHGRLAGLAHVGRLARQLLVLCLAMPSDASRRSFFLRRASSADGTTTSAGYTRSGRSHTRSRPTRAGDRHLAAHHQELQHLRDVAVVRPPGRRPRDDARVRDVPRGQRPRAAEQLEDVAAEAVVGRSQARVRS